MFAAIKKEIKENIFPDEDYYLLFHKKRFELLIKKIQEVVPDKDNKILDIGSHGLHVLMGLKFLNYNYLFGSDLNEFNGKAIGRANKHDIKLRDNDLSTGKIAYSDNIFDLLIFSETMEHLNFHPQKIFHEFARVLKPGAKIIITTPNLIRLNNRIKLLLGRSIHQDITVKYTVGTHYREYSAREIKLLLEKADLKIVESKYLDFNYPDQSMFINIINKVVGLIFISLKPNLVIIGEK